MCLLLLILSARLKLLFFCHDCLLKKYMHTKYLSKQNDEIEINYDNTSIV